MRRFLIAIPSAVIVLAAGLMVIPGFIDWSGYKQEAVTQIRAATGYDVEIGGDVKLSLFPWAGLRAGNVRASVPSGIEGQPGDTVVELERLDLNLALLPLLSGDIRISSLDLKKPVITLKTDKDGNGLWMTPELKAMSEGNAGENPRSDLALSFGSIDIEDGTLRYIDGVKGSETLVSGVNVDLSASSPQGPFTAQGNLEFGGLPVEIDVETGAIDAESGAAELKARAEINGAEISFAGAVNTKTQSAQGQMSVDADAPAATLSQFGVETQGLPQGPFEMKGMLTGSAKSVSWKDMSLIYGPYKLQGVLEANLAPVAVKADLKAADMVDLDSFMPAPDQSKSAAGPVPDFGAMIPKTLSLPASFGADITVAMPGIVYGGKIIKDVRAEVVRTDKGFDIAASAGELPGQGKAALTASLAYGLSQRDEKSGKTVLTQPSLTFAVQGDTSNLSQTIEAFSRTPVPALAKQKSASLNLKGTAAPGSLEIKDSVVRLGDSTAGLNISIRNAGSARPAVVLDVSADKMDFDSFMASDGKAEQAEAKSPADSLKSLNLPVDVTFDVGVQNAVLNKKPLSGLRAQGEITQNAVTFKNLSVQNFAGAAMTLQGGIADLAKLSGITVSAAAQSADIRELAKIAGMDVSAFPDKLDMTKINVKADGSAENLSFNASIQAMNGEATASGSLHNALLSGVEVNDLTLRVKHPKAASAIRIAAPGAPYYGSLSGPLDLYAELERQDKIYTLKNLKADISGAAVTGDVRYDASAAKPAITGNIDFTDLVLKTTATGASGPCCGESGNSTKKSGHWSAETIDSQWMKAADVNFILSGTSLIYENWDLKKPKLRFALKDGVMNVEQMQAGLYGGQADITAQLQGGGTGITFNAKPKLQNIDLESLVKSFVGVPIIKGQGKVNLTMDVAGGGSSQAAIVSSLRGSGTATGSAIVIEGLDVNRFAEAMSEETKPGDTALGLWKGVSKGGSTAFDTLDGAFDISSGVVNIQKMDLNGALSAIATKGTVDLPKWRIKTAHTITVKDTTKQIPPFTINIDGPLDNPGQTFAQGALNDYLQRKLTRKLDEKLGGKLEEKFGSGLGGVLGGALGLPQKQQPAAVTPAAPAAATPPAEVAPSEIAPADGAPAQTAPAETPPPQPEAAPAPEQAPAEPQQVTPEDALKGVLKGLLQ